MTFAVIVAPPHGNRGDKIETEAVGGFASAEEARAYAAHAHANLDHWLRSGSDLRSYQPMVIEVADHGDTSWPKRWADLVKQREAVRREEEERQAVEAEERAKAAKEREIVERAVALQQEAAAQEKAHFLDLARAEIEGVKAKAAKK
ncbi:hypothetical protein [Jiangella sp. DSM 45060]|uniref:hypothetical protein n=1 Tax=Jiangella sp. DSM 45060 TaxID=1798224 RepID=UPI00087A9B6F|nr:hypothetical protein [Jiangella sp. DSM 45060]SDT35635.1 hypothetical protein SAMN04515669_3692 [Jiangella sp. DSM 45060]